MGEELVQPQLRDGGFPQSTVRGPSAPGFGAGHKMKVAEDHLSERNVPLWRSD